MNKIGLAPLVAPLTCEEFMFDAWPKEPLVVHGLNETVRPLTELPFLQSLDALLNIWPTQVQVHLPDSRDESSAVDASPADAKKLYANEMSLLFNNAENVSPVLKEWLVRLTQDLGLPMSTYARCMVYATPAGRGTAPHFDQNINFVLQIKGTKKWWIAPNEHVENPTQRFTMGQELDSELASYASPEMPTVMPAKHQEIILNPGSMLFVPRGSWHSTEAHGEALALNFTLSQPTWIDLFTLALRSRLTLSADWRELADGVTSRNIDTRLIAQQKFDILLAGLIADLPHWRASDVLGATEGIS